MDIRKIRITLRASKFSGVTVYDPVVNYGGKALCADGELPGSLLRLMPRGWERARPSAWGYFVERAQELGRL